MHACWFAGQGMDSTHRLQQQQQQHQLLAAQAAVTRPELTWLKLLIDARKAGKAELLQPGRKLTSKCLARLYKPKLLSMSWSAKQLACTALRYARLLICRPGNGQHTLLTNAETALAAGRACSKACCAKTALHRFGSVSLASVVQKSACRGGPFNYCTLPAPARLTPSNPAPPTPCPSLGS